MQFCFFDKNHCEWLVLIVSCFKDSAVIFFAIIVLLSFCLGDVSGDHAILLLVRSEVII